MTFVSRLVTHLCWIGSNPQLASIMVSYSLWGCSAFAGYFSAPISWEFHYRTVFWNNDQIWSNQCVNEGKTKVQYISFKGSTLNGRTRFFSCVKIRYFMWLLLIFNFSDTFLYTPRHLLLIWHPKLGDAILQSWYVSDQLWIVNLLWTKIYTQPRKLSPLLLI